MGIFSKNRDQLIWQSGGETLAVEPWGRDSLRVRAVLMGELANTDYALLPQPACAVQIELGEGRATLTNGKITADIEEQGWPRRAVIRFYNQRGELLLQEIGDHGALALSARKFRPVIGGDYHLTASFEPSEGEKLYGMGQYQQEVLNVKDCSFELAHRNSQASVPFVLSSRGYGFLWHNPAVGRATFGKTRTEWVAERTKQLDYWITAGDTPAEIEEHYADATGKAPMMPEYGLGFWQCKLRYWNQEQLLEVAREYKRRGLPIDVIVCDFFHWPHMGDFRFEEEFFPDPDAMVRELKEMGIELMVSVWPQIALKSENFEEMREHGYLIRPETGVNVSMQFVEDSVFMDATNPGARRYVWEKCKKNYYEKGVRIFWLDEAEPEYGTYDFENYRYYIGPNLQIGNIYPQMYSRAFYEGMTEAGQENVVNLVRCAWAGSQRYGALVWSGDIHCTFEDFRRQICAGIHMGICGIPWWTTDIGGFSGGDPRDEHFRELLVRWFQYGTFCPVMRLHGDRSPAEPVYHKDGTPALNSGSDNEVWSFGEPAYEILVKHMKFRETMRPYTRELMREAHEKGAPVIRGMFYEFPENAACWDIQDQYMYGGDVLVAPVTAEGLRSREVYLPAGAEWTELHSGKSYAGGQTVTADAPLETMPVYLKNGSHADWIGLL